MFLAITLPASAIILAMLASAVVSSLLALGLFYLRFKPQFDGIDEQKKVIAYLQQQMVALSRNEEDHKEQLLKQKEQIASLRAQVEGLSGYVDSSKPSEQNFTILAVIGTDNATRPDLVALRQSGIDCMLSHPPTLDSFEKRLNNLRATGRLPSGIHFALHAGPDGIQFDDQLATKEWLSDNIKDVHIVVIAGCRGSDIGYGLASRNQRVLTVQHNIESGDAALLTRVFWEQVARGKDVITAYQETKHRLPPGVAELIELH